jgi:hypothetical protein
MYSPFILLSSFYTNLLNKYILLIIMHLHACWMVKCEHKLVKIIYCCLQYLHREITTIYALTSLQYLRFDSFHKIYIYQLLAHRNA